MNLVFMDVRNGCLEPGIVKAGTVLASSHRTTISPKFMIWYTTAFTAPSWGCQLYQSVGGFVNGDLR